MTGIDEKTFHSPAPGTPLGEDQTFHPVPGGLNQPTPITFAGPTYHTPGGTPVAAGNPLDLKPGQGFARYRIDAQLGEGGMGMVYRATDLRLERTVALKVMRGELSLDPTFRERFLREARAAARIISPQVVSIYESDELNGVLFMAFEFVPGGDLSQLVKGNGPLEARRAAEIIAHCALGLQAIHEAGLIHRDIKPQNIFLDDKGRPKLGDLGLARQQQEDSHMTQAGTAMGTPAYMAPEQAEGASDIDIRADIHALGATLYTLVTGKAPYSGNTPWAVVHQVIGGPVPDPRSLRKDLPAGVAELILKAMAKKREERFQTPQELHRAALALCAPPERIVIGPEPRAVPPPPPVVPPSPSGPGTMPNPRGRMAPAVPNLPKKPLINVDSLIRAVVTLALVGAAIWWFGVERPRQAAAAQAEVARQDAERNQRVDALLARMAVSDEPIGDAGMNAISTALHGLTTTAEDAPAFPEALATKLNAAWAAKQKGEAAARVLAGQKAEAAALKARITALPDDADDAAQAAMKAAVEAWRDLKPPVVLQTEVATALLRRQQAIVAAKEAAAAKAAEAEAQAAAAAAETRRNALVAARGDLDQLDACVPLPANTAEKLAAYLALAGPDDVNGKRWKAKLDEVTTLKHTLSALDLAAATQTQAQATAAQRLAALVGNDDKDLVRWLPRLPAPAPWSSRSGWDSFGAWSELQAHGVVQRLRWLRPGTYSMGSPEAEAGRDRTEGLRSVTLTHGAWLADTECTQALYETVTGRNPSFCKGDPERPVEQVSWQDARNFCTALMEFSSGTTVRLPTEAEWEYACRAGTATPFAGPLAELAVSGGGEKPLPVRSKAPNAWGFYDMHGNVLEWCADWYAPYDPKVLIDPTGPATGSKRINRGGYWKSPPAQCRSAARAGYPPEQQNIDLGFRFLIESRNRR